MNQPTRNLIALSLAAPMLMLAAPAPALAQTSSVQMYGLVGLYVGRTERSGGPAAVTQMGHGGLTTSYLGFRGSEDLGTGLKAIFSLEAFFRPDTGSFGRTPADPFFSRNSWVGFEGGFGRATFGRQTNPTYSNLATLSAFGGSTVFSPLVLQTFIGTYGGAILGDTVWDNAIQYAAPKWGGLSASAIYSFGEVAGDSGRSNYGVHARYLNGPFSVAASVQHVEVPMAAPMTAQDAWIAGATYDFKMAKLFGSIGHTSADGVKNDTRTTSFGVRVPTGRTGAVMAEWARTKREAAVETTRNTASVGYDYFLSKRTDLYAVYSRDKLTSFDSANTFAVGIRHTF
jgi:predicted porin